MDQKQLDDLESQNEEVIDDNELLENNEEEDSEEKANDVNEIINNHEEKKKFSSGGKKEKKNTETKKEDDWSWDDDDDDEPRPGRGWKIFSGLLLILLIAAIYTNGFNFGDNKLTGAAASELTKIDAEEKVLDYINNNLLRPPFTAEVISSEELDSLFKITVSVAGQEVDSYLTKDGKYFFPQGFDLEAPSLDLETPEASETELVDVSEGKVKETIETETEEPGEALPIESEETEEPEEIGILPSETEEPSVAEIKELKVSTKKWRFFDPQQPDELSFELTVNKGDQIKIILSSIDIEHSFELPQFQISEVIPAGGETEITFTADKAGTFTFASKSFAGMTGRLIVE